jgi:hypothetical protein
LGAWRRNATEGLPEPWRKRPERRQDWQRHAAECLAKTGRAMRQKAWQKPGKSVQSVATTGRATGRKAWQNPGKSVQSVVKTDRERICQRTCNCAEFLGGHSADCRLLSGCIQQLLGLLLGPFRSFRTSFGKHVWQIVTCLGPKDFNFLSLEYGLWVLD